MKKLKVSKIVALAGIAAVLFGFASCDTNADDSSNLAAAVLLGQKSGGTAGTGITLQMEQHQMQPYQEELPVTEPTKQEKKMQTYLACMS